MDVSALNSTRNTIAAEPPMDRAIRPVVEKSAPEILPREEKACTLHISDEGYRRWELARQEIGAQTQQEISTQAQQESTAGTLPKNGAATAGAKETVAVAAGAEENAEPEPDRMTKLSQFIETRRYLLSHLKPIASKETDDEKVAAMEQLRQLEEEQEAQYRRQEAEAQALAKKSSKSRNTLEKGMRELTIMLESVKPQDEAEKEKAEGAEREGKQQDAAPGQENRQWGTAPEKDDEKNVQDTREAMQGIGRWIMRHASRAEEAMDATIGHIYEKAWSNFSYARDLDGLLLGSLERLSHMLAQPDVSEEDKNAAVDAYIMDGRKDLKEIYSNMGFGLERLKTLRTLNIGRLANQNMVYADRAQEGIHALADETALEELYQDSFQKLEDNHFEELAERIKALQEAEQNPETEQAQKEAQEAQQATEAAEEKERREKEEILPN